MWPWRHQQLNDSLLWNTIMWYEHEESPWHVKKQWNILSSDFFLAIKKACSLFLVKRSFPSSSGIAESQKWDCCGHFVIVHLVSYQSCHLCSCWTFLEHLDDVFHSEAVGCACFVSSPWIAATLAQKGCAVLCLVPCPVRQSGRGLHLPSCSLF